MSVLRSSATKNDRGGIPQRIKSVRSYHHDLRLVFGGVKVRREGPLLSTKLVDWHQYSSRFERFGVNQGDNVLPFEVGRREDGAASSHSADEAFAWNKQGYEGKYTNLYRI